MKLVPNRWYIIAESDEIRAGHPLAARRHGEELVLWRDTQGVLRCTADRCPHRGASLALGTVQGDAIVCPFHGFQFRGSDGQCTHIPAQGDQPPPRGYAVPARVVREAHGFVWLWVGAPRETYPEPPWFADLDDPKWRWRAGRMQDDWPIHWTRVVENQFDFTHLPFVHASTIGRFVDQQMDVKTESDGADYLKTWAGNQEAGVLELHAPNLWRNRIGASTYIMAVFVPLDEGHTRTYIRYYQSHVPWPVLSTIYGWVMSKANAWILSQDRRVVTSQTPPETSLRNGEKLLASDAPIIWFRRWRDRHMDDPPDAT